MLFILFVILGEVFDGKNVNLFFRDGTSPMKLPKEFLEIDDLTDVKIGYIWNQPETEKDKLTIAFKKDKWFVIVFLPNNSLSSLMPSRWRTYSVTQKVQLLWQNCYLNK